MWKIDEQKAQFYKIASFGQDMFTYYGFDTGGDFNIVGFSFMDNERIALRLMRIDGEFLDDESFSAEQHGGPYFYCDVLGCKQFLHFVEYVILRQEVRDRKMLRYFEMLDASALRSLHYPETWNGVGRWYRYTEKTLSEEGEEKLSLMCLPRCVIHHK